MMSGTSQSAAIVSGIVALMLDADPTLTPDTVKCRLMVSAQLAIDENGNLAYSVFQQGAGLVNAYEAIESTESDCANQGLDIAHDLSGAEHYQGAAAQDAEGNFYIPGLEGMVWDGSYAWGDSFAWSGNYNWTENPDWQASPASINQWVPQE